MHRRLPVLAALLLALLLGFPGADAAAVLVMEDPAGDHGFAAAGQDTPASHARASDLRSLDVTEEKASVAFRLVVEGMEDEPGPYADDVQYTLDFSARGADYRIVAFLSLQSASASAYLATRDTQSGFYRDYEPVEATVETSTKALTVVVPRALLVGSDGAPLLRDDILAGFAAESRSVAAALAGGFTFGTVEGGDRMPDQGTAPTVVPMRLGAAQQGTVQAYIPDPVRVSNGEATTHLYIVKVRNKSDRPDTVEVRAEGTPADWTLTFPQKEVRLEAEGESDVPVLVTVPFHHLHGTYLAANVTFQSRSDPLSHASVVLGIRYTKVPQPAGHHNTIHWHDGNGRPFVNTLENDTIPEGEGGETPSSWTCSFGGAESGRGRLVPLVPDLDLGIDVDMAANGTATLVMASDTPVPGTHSVGGYIVVWYGDKTPSPCVHEAPPEAIAALERSAPLQLEAGVPQAVTLKVTPLAYGDRLERKPDIHMAFIVAVYQEAGLPLANSLVPAPMVQEGSFIQLPLKEYHDKVDQYFSTLSGVDLFATSGQQRLVNPGETVVFEVMAEMLGTTPGDFALELTGANTAWARIVEGPSLHLEPNEKRTISVAVRAPDTATTGMLADLTLHAVKVDDANVRSLIRLLATVETGVDLQDEAPRVAEIEEKAKDTAAPGLILLCAMGGVAWARRRGARQ